MLYPTRITITIAYPLGKETLLWAAVTGPIMAVVIRFNTNPNILPPPKINTAHQNNYQQYQ